MVSIRNSQQTVEARILDAAAECVLAYGVERMTLTDIAPADRTHCRSARRDTEPWCWA
jgi:hypothetical protein